MKRSPRKRWRYLHPYLFPLATAVVTNPRITNFSINILFLCSYSLNLKFLILKMKHSILVENYKRPFKDHLKILFPYRTRYSQWSANTLTIHWPCNIMNKNAMKNIRVIAITILRSNFWIRRCRNKYNNIIFQL